MASVLAAALVGAGPAAAYSVIHSHSPGPGNPRAALIADASGNLYGTTERGGTSNCGTVFTMKADGTGFSVLHSFAGRPGDGEYPWASLVLDGSGNLYGTTYSGGASGLGTVFTLRTDGTGFSVLHSFAGGLTDGQNPYAALILDATGNLYGTTYAGGGLDLGTVFTLRTDGTGFSVLHFFGGSPDGGSPWASLILDASGNLYGTTCFGGASGGGTVFKLRTDGTGFSVLRSFGTGPRDGWNPYASLVLDAVGKLYGTTRGGGEFDYGTVFTIRTDGTGFAILRPFSGVADDGENPYASLILDATGTLYGTTRKGGASSGGTVFKLRTDGTGFSVLASFAWNAGTGWIPQASLILDASGNLHGTTPDAGTAGAGTVFRIRTDGTGFSTLHRFVPGAADGWNPDGSLVLDDSGTLYGTTPNGGTSNVGTVFRIGTDGTGFSTLRSFATGSSDGQYPHGSLVLDGSGNLYGTTVNGGVTGAGTVFRVKTDGTGFSILHSFGGGAGDGGSPYASPILEGSVNLYGTTSGGGSSWSGTVFRLRTWGAGFSVLHSFAGGAGDGRNPDASLILHGSDLFGTTVYGGASSLGTIFKLKTDGAGFSVLHSFAGGAGDGKQPHASLILDASGNLYGTTRYGGASDAGTVFTIRTDGTGFSVLHSFAGGAGDGKEPLASLILDGSGNLYGTTFLGGASDAGTVFTIRTDGTGFSILHSFASGQGDGQYPRASLVLDASGNLYGTTSGGGTASMGTEFTLPALCAPGVPVPPTGSAASRCGPGAVTLSASGAGAGHDYKWYDAPAGGALLQTGGASFTTPPLFATTTYYASAFDTTTLCESGRTAVTASVNPIPAAPTAGSEAAVCQGETIHLTASTVAGASYSWTGPDGFGSATQNPVITNAQPADGGTYSVTVTVDGCESAPATTTTAVTPDSSAPAVTAPAGVAVTQSLCCGASGAPDADTSATLAAFLAGGSASDDCVATPSALAPQVGGVDVTGTTCFAAGTTTVTFRFSDAAGNVGTSTADVTVRLYGDLDADDQVTTADMVVLQSYFNFAATPGVPPFAAPQETADLTHDTLVDPADMVQLQAYFNFAVSCLAP